MVALLLPGLQGLAPPARAQASPPAAEPPTLFVQRFDVVGNTLLPAEDIERRLADFKGDGTLQRLRDAAAAVQDLYRHAGYGGVVAFLPEQKPKDGVVSIRVVEGQLARIDVVDNRQFSRDNILASLPALVTGATPNVRLIDAQIQIANENPAKSVQVLLQPGDAIASVAARVTVAEQPVQRWSARLDNTGSESTGRWRAALGWQHANVLGRDHVFQAEAQTSPESPKAVAVLSGAYRVPLYPQAMAVDVFGVWSDVDSGKVGTAAGDLEFSGRGYVAGLRATAYLPRWGRVDHRLALGLDAREYLNECGIEGLPAGACGSAGASVSVQPLSLGWTLQSGGDYRLGLHVSLHHNLALGGKHGEPEDFEAVRPGSEQRYTVLRANGQATLPLEGWGAVAVRASGQYSGDPLVPGELFGIGGQYSVRGFEERELGGDSGLQASIEYISHNVGASWLGLQRGDWRWLVFGDAGWVSNLNGDSCLPAQTRCRIASLGAGLRLSVQQLQLRLDLARAMSAAAATARGDVRAHVALMYNF